VRPSVSPNRPVTFERFEGFTVAQVRDASVGHRLSEGAGVDDCGNGLFAEKLRSPETEVAISEHVVRTDSENCYWGQGVEDVCVPGSGVFVYGFTSDTDRMLGVVKQVGEL
jgi:hypothetical protein